MRPIRKSLQEYARGVAGGLLFSLPLLYTMEVWWSGFLAPPWRLAAYVLVTFALLLGYNHYVGIRVDRSVADVVIESFEEMGIGFVIAALVLWLLGQITVEMPGDEVLGKIVIEAMTVAIGVSVGTAQLGAGDPDKGMNHDSQGADDGDDGDDDDWEPDDDSDDWDLGDDDAGAEPGKGGDEQPGENTVGSQLVIALCGAVLFAANVAPTEEIVMIAVEVSPGRLIGLVVFSLALAALVLYYSAFAGSRQHVRFDRHHDVLIGSVITYAVALVASALILWFFGRFDGHTPTLCLAQTVVLGVPATLGASAGRLLLQ
jgi:putative integral membrane protein (TIGR02587 family)